VEIPTPISFREGGRKFRVLHVFRPPAFDDWLEYEQKLQRSVEIVGDATKFDRREAEAAEAVWERIILRVEGYLVTNSSSLGAVLASGGAGIPAGAAGQAGMPAPPSGAQQAAPLQAAFLDCWREKVDVLHKIAAVRLLAQVYPQEFPEPEPGEAGDDGLDAAKQYCFDPDRVEVRLLAARGGVECDGLVHVLRRPTAREQKEFSRVASSALYVRGSRAEKSLLPSRLREFVRFYDSLIQEVRGYTAQGLPATRDDAVHHMDALHKQTAASALFSFEA
jgi:hypothetical protein